MHATTSIFRTQRASDATSAQQALAAAGIASWLTGMPHAEIADAFDVHIDVRVDDQQRAAAVLQRWKVAAHYATYDDVDNDAETEDHDGDSVGDDAGDE